MQVVKSEYANQSSLSSMSTRHSNEKNDAQTLHTSPHVPTKLSSHSRSKKFSLHQLSLKKLSHVAPSLCDWPNDVLWNVFSFIHATELIEDVLSTCRSLYTVRLNHSSSLWLRLRDELRQRNNFSSQLKETCDRWSPRDEFSSLSQQSYCSSVRERLFASSSSNIELIDLIHALSLKYEVQRGRIVMQSVLPHCTVLQVLISDSSLESVSFIRMRARSLLYRSYIPLSINDEFEANEWQPVDVTSHELDVLRCGSIISGCWKTSINSDSKQSPICVLPTKQRQEKRNNIAFIFLCLQHEQIVKQLKYYIYIPGFLFLKSEHPSKGIRVSVVLRKANRVLCSINFVDKLNMNEEIIYQCKTKRNELYQGKQSNVDHRYIQRELCVPWKAGNTCGVLRDCMFVDVLVKYIGSISSQSTLARAQTMNQFRETVTQQRATAGKLLNGEGSFNFAGLAADPSQMKVLETTYTLPMSKKDEVQRRLLRLLILISNTDNCGPKNDHNESRTRIICATLDQDKTSLNHSR